MDGETITLNHPITLTFNQGKPDERQETISEVSLRRPRTKDLRVVDGTGGDVAAAIALVARLTGLAIVQVDELDAEDFGAIMEKVAGFTPPGLLTGKTGLET